MRYLGFFGILAVCLFFISIVLFGIVHPNFHFLQSYVSELGAQHAPHAHLFNTFGFVIPGVLLLLFGWNYGQFINDRLAGILLGVFGIAFAFTAIPIDSLQQDTPYARAHVVAICIALAAWLFGLARLAGNKSLSPRIRKTANITAGILIFCIALGAIEAVSMPITHRMVFGTVFGWTIITSIRTIEEMKKKKAA